MKANVIVALLLLLCTGGAEANSTLICKVVGLKTEIKESRKDFEILRITSVKLAVSAKVVKLVAFDKNNKVIKFDPYGSQKEQVTVVEFVRQPNANPEKQGIASYQANNVNVEDQGYGDHFWFYATNVKGVIHVRLWAATIGEPSDETGHQELYNNTNLLLSCK